MYFNAIELVKQFPDVNITVRGGELLEMVDHCISESKKQLEQIIQDSAAETYPSPDTVAKVLDVDKSTLWRWHKSGYLEHIEIGGKRRYKMSDIQRILNGGRK